MVGAAWERLQEHCNWCRAPIGASVYEPHQALGHWRRTPVHLQIPMNLLTEMELRGGSSDC
jgi:hypothetical protein